LIRLCRDDALEEGDACGFRFGEGAAEKRLFVLRWEGLLKGYLNVCPHVGTPLDWVPDKFFHPDDRHLICATHGALFLPENGLCVAGPCEGESLQAVEVAVEDGWIVYRG
jgi:nitrite reductase/ring-hydroxylating ferredoxin subunit